MYRWFLLIFLLLGCVCSVHMAQSFITTANSLLSVKQHFLGAIQVQYTVIVHFTECDRHIDPSLWKARHRFELLEPNIDSNSYTYETAVGTSGLQCCCFQSFSNEIGWRSIICYANINLVIIVNMLNTKNIRDACVTVSQTQMPNRCYWAIFGTCDETTFCPTALEVEQSHFKQ